jgi:hypothetical protein
VSQPYSLSEIGVNIVRQQLCGWPLRLGLPEKGAVACREVGY